MKPLRLLVTHDIDSNNIDARLNTMFPAFREEIVNIHDNSIVSLSDSVDIVWLCALKRVKMIN